jgi:DNA-binding transcriptional MerR regulator
VPPPRRSVPAVQFRFSAPDRRRIWRELALTMSQAATLTGVSERQIQHWMDRGYIDAASEGARKISGHGLDMIVLIKQARAAGIPLRQAVPLARIYLNQETTGALDSEMARLTLRDLQEKLGALRGAIESVQRLIQDVSIPDGHAPDSPLPPPPIDRVSSQGRH